MTLPRTFASAFKSARQPQNNKCHAKRANPVILQACSACSLPKMEVFGTDYPTPDGTCIRDYIHVSDLVAAHSDALAYLRGGAASAMLNCGYGRGFSVLDVIETVKRVSGVDFKVEIAGRRPGDPARIVAAADRARATLNWQPHFDDLQTIVSHALGAQATTPRRWLRARGPR